MENLSKTVKRKPKNARRKKGTASAVPKDAPHIRTPNWSEDETTILLEVAEEVKIKFKKSDINFKESEYNEIHRIFSSRRNNCSRTPDNLYHRIKHLKSQFNNAKYYSLKSGWAWDHDLHMLIPPSNEILEDIITADPAKLNFLRKPFPWYLQLLKLCGGNRARGDELDRVGLIPRYQRRANTQNSSTGSSSESSRENRVDFEVNQEPDANVEDDIGSSRFTGQQGSDSINPSNRSSDSSKRKSTDEAEPSSRGNKIKKTLNERTEFFRKAAENSATLCGTHKDMVSIFQQHFTNAQQKQSRLEVEDREKKHCLERLDALCIQGPLRFKIIQKFMEPATRMVWIHGRDDDVFNWINETFPSPRNPQPFDENPMSSMNQPTPNMSTNLTDLLTQFLNSYPRTPAP